MSDIGEYWNESREKEQKRKADRQKWNTDIILWAEVEYGIRVVKHTDFHYSLYHPDKRRLDVYPSTGKVIWIKKNKTTFAKVIDDIEAYLQENFKPKE